MVVEPVRSASTATTFLPLAASSASVTPNAARVAFFSCVCSGVASFTTLLHSIQLSAGFSKLGKRTLGFFVVGGFTGSTTTKKFAEACPENAKRLFNVGIAEQNMIDVAAGLSLTGNIAYTGSFAVFGTGRAYDQIRNTVCYSNLNVKVAPTHAGISVGPDGGSHQMLEDISLMRGLPNMRVLVPADYAACCAAIRLAAETPGPVYIRMGRAAVPAVYAPDGGSHQACFRARAFSTA